MGLLFVRASCKCELMPPTLIAHSGKGYYIFIIIIIIFAISNCEACSDF